ncbi:MAG: alginate export family protein [Ignavibacteria bacterium]|jgi:hypothetical protein
MKKNLFLCAVFALLNFNAYAQLNIGFEIRPRTEYRDGYSRLLTTDQTPAFVTTQRSRIVFDYISNNFSSRISLQDVRTWGDESLTSSTGVFGDQSSIDLNEAWIKAKLTDCLSLKIGRQYFVYDDERLLSKRNWNQSSVKYDALLFSYEFNKNKSKLDAGFSYNNDKDNKVNNYYSSEKIKTLNFVHYSNKLFDSFGFSLIALITGTTPNDTTNVIYLKGTYGININYRESNFGINASSYFQTGKDVAAYLISSEALYSISPVEFKLGGTLVSGNDGSKQDDGYKSKEHAFDIFYGSRHRFFGLMDHFNNLPEATNSAGLIDLYSSLKWNLKSSASTQVQYHYLATQYKSFKNSILLEEYLASEIDITALVKFSKYLKLDFGYSILIPSDSYKTIQLDNLPAQKAAHWIWFMLTANFDFQINN